MKNKLEYLKKCKDRIKDDCHTCQFYFSELYLGTHYPNCDLGFDCPYEEKDDKKDKPSDDSLIDKWQINGKFAELHIVKGKLQVRYLGSIHNVDKPLSELIELMNQQNKKDGTEGGE